MHFYFLLIVTSKLVGPVLWDIRRKFPYLNINMAIFVGFFSLIYHFVWSIIISCVSFLFQVILVFRFRKLILCTEDEVCYVAIQICYCSFISKNIDSAIENLNITISVDLNYIHIRWDKVHWKYLKYGDKLFSFRSFIHRLFNKFIPYNKFWMVNLDLSLKIKL